jgi:hypothetical protein
MCTQTYPTDMTDRQWQCINDLIPPPKPGGRPRSLDMRQVINAILYILVSGIQWRMLPKDYPKWQSVYHYFRQWRDDVKTTQVPGERGYDSAKRVKGRKRHLLVDTLGLISGLPCSPLSRAISSRRRWISAAWVRACSCRVSTWFIRVWTTARRVGAVIVVGSKSSGIGVI